MIGTLDETMVSAVMDTLRAELTIIDADGRVVGWNKNGSRAFRRSEAILGTDVLDCHSPKSRDTVGRLLEEMRRGERDRAHFWVGPQGGAPDDDGDVLVEYYALRDADGNYIGCVEAIEDLSKALSLKGGGDLPGSSEHP